MSILVFGVSWREISLTDVDDVLAQSSKHSQIYSKLLFISNIPP